MIVLDTNVISEFMGPAPAPQVVRWANRQPNASIWTTTITVYEIRMGLLAMPAGKRKTALFEQFQRWLTDVIESRVLSFDVAAAEQASELAAARRKAGRAGEHRDTMIAGIVAANRATLATRNTRHFAELKSHVVNPWQE